MANELKILGHIPALKLQIDWVVKKPQQYCRPHGLKIVGYINGVGLCQKCVEE